MVHGVPSVISARLAMSLPCSGPKCRVDKVPSGFPGILGSRPGGIGVISAITGEQPEQQDSLRWTGSGQPRQPG